MTAFFLWLPFCILPICILPIWNCQFAYCLFPLLPFSPPTEISPLVHYDFKPFQITHAFGIRDLKWLEIVKYSWWYFISNLPGVQIYDICITYCDLFPFKHLIIVWSGNSWDPFLFICQKHENNVLKYFHYGKYMF